MVYTYSMRTLKTEGIVIRRRNIGEADKILTIFTRDLGKVQVKAKGVRRITSRRSPHIELLNHASVSLYKSEKMSILTEAQVIEDYEGLKKNLTRVWAAYHLCELVDGLCPENQEHENVFTLLTTTLTKLSYEKQLKPLIHDFEVQLLTILGFWHEGEAKEKNTQALIEELLERRLKSKYLFSKLQ